MVSFGQEFEDMSQLSKERIKFPMEEKIIRGGTPVLKWIVGNVVMWQELAGHIKPDKKIRRKNRRIFCLSWTLTEKYGNNDDDSIYDECGLPIIWSVTSVVAFHILCTEWCVQRIWNREMDEKIKNKTLAIRDTGVMNIFDTRKVKCLIENFEFDGLV